MQNKKVAILGTVGVPANYGGFETLVENLVHYHLAQALSYDVTVYCSSKSYEEHPSSYLSAKLKYIPLQANGAQSIAYDMWSLLSAMWRSDVILLLGVSGATILPLIRLLSSAKIVTNIDGIEWRREKWQGLAKWFLRFSEKIAVRFSHEVIADNGGIAEYVKETYGVDAHVIAYGGDHAVSVEAQSVEDLTIPQKYAFSVCRIEPENNVHMIVEAFAKQSDLPLVMVGNWKSSNYGRNLQQKYHQTGRVMLLDPIYDIGKLKTLRANAALYVHGHSAGGTNPSLVEAMHFGMPIVAFDCVFNRCTTENKAFYFDSVEALNAFILTLMEKQTTKMGRDLQDVANRRYTWSVVAEQYFHLL